LQEQSGNLYENKWALLENGVVSFNVIENK